MDNAKLVPFPLMNTNAGSIIHLDLSMVEGTMVMLLNVTTAVAVSVAFRYAVSVPSVLPAA